MYSNSIVLALMMKKLMFLFFVLLGLNVLAQYNISGKIVDENNESLPGANIFIPELNKGTAAQKNGDFLITDLRVGKYKLQISYIGFETVIKDVEIISENVNVKVELHECLFQSQEVVISGGRPTSQHENAIKIETINVSNIQTSGTPSLMESIAQLPGVSMISKGSGVTTPVIRGLSTSNILVLNNGIRMENYQFSIDHPYLIDEFGLEKVEVIKGPASLLYGSDAIGGVMNFIKENPANIGTVEGDANLQYFSNTNGFNGNLGIKGSGDKLYWGLRGGMKTHADYLDGNGKFIPNTRFNQNSVKSFLGLNTTSGIFRIYYDYIKMKPGMCVEPVVGVINERGRKNEMWYQDLNMHMLSTKNTFFLNAFKMEANLAYQYNHRRLNANVDNPPLTQVDTKLNTLNYEFKTSYNASDRSNLIVSIQGMSQRNKNQDAPAHVLPDYSLNDISISGLVQHDFEGGIHLQLGLRFDNRFIDVPEQEIHGHDHGDEGDGEEEDVEIFEQLDRYYGNLSGSMGVTYDLAEHLLIRGNIASAYRTPNIAELTQEGHHGTRYEMGDRNLNSQRNYEGDLSLHFHSQHFMFDMAGFYNYVLQYIYLAPTADTIEDGDLIFRYLQNDAALYGFEALAEVVILHDFKVKGDYSFVRGKQTNGDNLPFIPQNQLNFELVWNKNDLWKFRSFYIKAGTKIYFDQDFPSPYETYTSGFTLFDAGLGFAINAGKQVLNLDVIATNIFDRTYIDHLSTLKPLGFFNPGRNISVNLKIPFGFSM